VKQVFEFYARGVHTKQQVLEMVTAAGLRTQHGMPVSKQTFDHLLRKPVYTGWIQIDRWHERVRGDFEPLVSQEIFDMVQAVLSGKRVSVTPRLRSHLRGSPNKNTPSRGNHCRNQSG
jgi:hypothetical protein